jgi:hypothetical protein
VPNTLRPSLETAKRDNPRRRSSGCSADYATTEIPTCIDGDPASPTTVMLIGDSHAAQWFGAFERLSRVRGWRLMAHTKSTCAFVDHPTWLGELKRSYTECTEWGRGLMAVIARERPALVVLSHTRSELLDIDGEGVSEADRPDVWDAALTRTIEEVLRYADGVVILGDTPVAVPDPPACLARSPHDVLACARPMRNAIADARHALDLAIAEQTGAAFIDPDPFVCPSDPCPPVIGDIVVYRDSRHLTNTFVTEVAPYLMAELPSIEE